MSAIAVRKWSEPEYLRMERASMDKHEYLDGELFAMAGCSRAHDSIAASVLIAFGSRLRGTPCEPHTSDMRIHIPATRKYTYSDGLITCGPQFTDDTQDTLLNPCVIVEVLSDSTEAYDRGDKFTHYRSIPTLRDYLLLSQQQVLVEHHLRQPDGAWSRRELRAGAVLRLTALPLAIAVHDLYPHAFAR